jgi:predicted O-methyltransferase YrrM
MSNSTLGLTEVLADYYRLHAFNEHPLLAELRAETALLGGEAQMQIAPEQGAFMGLLAGLINARAILEIGTFTGYSSLAMALGCTARITAVDVSADWTAIARRYWERAGVSDRITLRLDGGHVAIAALLAEGRHGSFDLVFLDADKVSYDDYYEGALLLLRSGGVVLIDNVLWGGDVADPARTDEDTVALRALNAKIKTDPRVHFVMLPLADGLTLAQKL